MLVAGGAGAAIGGVTYGVTHSRHQTQVVRSTIAVGGLPPRLDGLRIGLMTDLHHSHMVPQSDIVHAASLLMNEAPDLIILGGDYVSWGERRYMPPCAEALSALRAPCGVFAVMGNHDDDREMPAALTGRGFEVLRDARTTLVARGEPLNLIGIRYWTMGPRTIARLMKGAEGPTILLSHDPRRLAAAAELDIPLVLSGHTHGGQVVLPIVGAVAARRFPVIAGLGRRGNTSIFVSRGVGTVYVPYRVNCPADVSVLTLTG